MNLHAVRQWSLPFSGMLRPQSPDYPSSMLPYCHAVRGCSVILARIKQLCFPKLEHQPSARAIQIMDQAWDVES